MVNMSEEKSQQRKWTREEIVILVTEYFRTKNMLSSEIEESYHRISDFLRKKSKLIQVSRYQICLETMQG